MSPLRYAPVDMTLNPCVKGGRKNGGFATILPPSPIINRPVMLSEFTSRNICSYSLFPAIFSFNSANSEISPKVVLSIAGC
jgi:hypothetical protein